MTQQITFIGCGNMGGSLIEGLIKSGYPQQAIYGIEPDELKRQTLEQSLGIKTAAADEQIIKNSDVLVLAIKPQVFLSSLSELKPFIKDDCLLISIAAGINCQSIEQSLSPNAVIVRVMPNTPSLINLGAAGMYANKNVSSEQKQLAENILNAVGMVSWVEDESLIDAITAVSGSGPAYYFFMMEVMQKIASELGLEPQQATKLVKQTALGAATMASMTDETLEQLRTKVTSPGGTTEAAINTLIEQQFEQMIRQALIKAKNRFIRIIRTIWSSTRLMLEKNK